MIGDNNVAHGLPHRFQNPEQNNRVFFSHLNIIGEILTNLNYVNNKLLNKKEISEMSDGLPRMKRIFNELCQFIINEAKIILPNIDSNKNQLTILKNIFNSEFKFSDQDTIDGDYAVRKLEKKIDTCKKILIKSDENKEKLKVLQLKIEEIEKLLETFKNMFSHLEYNSLKYIYGGAFGGGAAGIIGALIALIADGFLGDSGNLMVAGCCVNPLTAIVTTAFGTGLLISVFALSVTQYLKLSSKENVDKLNQLHLNAKSLLIKMEKLDTLLDSLYVAKEIIKVKTIGELQDCFENEPQRKGNSEICDKMFQENEKLIELLSEIIASETN